MNESETTKIAKAVSKSTEKKSKEIEKDPEQWNRHLSDILCKKVSVSLTKEGFQSNIFWWRHRDVIQAILSIIILNMLIEN